MKYRIQTNGSSKIPNQIIKEPLQELTLNKVDSIALHHMAHPTADVKTIEAWHISQGWRAIGYNYWVAFDGTVYEGRGLHLGAGVANQNGHIISIGFQGDYHSSPVDMPDTQFNAGIDIIHYVMEKVPTIKNIGGHGDFMATACPGQYFPLQEMKTLKKREVQKMKMFQDVPTDDYGYKHIQKLLDYGVINGDENGNFNPDAPATRRDTAIMIANALTVCGK